KIVHYANDRWRQSQAAGHRQADGCFRRVQPQAANRSEIDEGTTGSVLPGSGMGCQLRGKVAGEELQPKQFRCALADADDIEPEWRAIGERSWYDGSPMRTQHGVSGTGDAKCPGE